MPILCWGGRIDPHWRGIVYGRDITRCPGERCPACGEILPVGPDQTMECKLNPHWYLSLAGRAAPYDYTPVPGCKHLCGGPADRAGGVAGAGQQERTKDAGRVEQ